MQNNNQNDSDTLRILLFSDIHMQSPGGASNVGTAIEKLKENKDFVKYDYVFVSGDIADLPNEIGKTLDNEVVLKDLRSLLYEQIAPLANEMFYIPGNHDPIEYFSSDDDKNLHKSMAELRPDLVVLGLGGSVQNYV